MSHPKKMPQVTPLNRAISKLGILSRSQATAAIRQGRVRVDGRVVSDPAALVVPERARIAINGEAKPKAAWRTIAFHKPRGVVTTRRDPEGRTTIYDALGEAGRGLIAVGRLDRATSGLLLLTTDTQLANWVTDPANAVPRVYFVTVRGKVDEARLGQLERGIGAGAARVRADSVAVRKVSGRESHLTVTLTEGRNREVRRLFEAIGHEVTRLKRVSVGGVGLADLEAGQWRDISPAEIHRAFRGAPRREG